MSLLLSIFIGIGLSAAAGFRVFTPLLLTNVAAHFDLISLTYEFEWLGSTAATIVFGVAFLVELAAYYIPFVDNAIKVLATPFSLVAGTLLTASFIGDLDLLMTWAIAIIAGGGTASITQMTSGAIRGASTIATGGLGNMAVTFFDGFFALFITLLTFVLPIFGLIALIIIIIVAIAMYKKRPQLS